MMISIGFRKQKKASALLANGVFISDISATFYKRLLYQINDF